MQEINRIAGTQEIEDEAEVALADRMRAAREQILSEIRRRIIGQEEVVEQVLLSLFVGGHSLLVGVPGLAKTLLIRTVADVLDLSFSRIQFTPDLMPSDITGTDLIQEDADTGRRFMKFESGPIFANIVLADEINRTPPKTQAALLEAMQEKHVTVQGTTYPLDLPFHVFATQNPIELEGTYPLPEAQLDRFMFEIQIDHLSEAEELDVVRATTGVDTTTFTPTIGRDDLLAFQQLVRQIPAPEPVLRYAVSLVRASRPSPNGDSADFVKEWIAYGASVRAAQYLILGGKARALTMGRYTPSFDDIRALALPVLRHRVLRNFHAESEGKTQSDLIAMLLEHVPVPSSRM
ncbi:MAG: AAA family ATPase [Longimicrobiales bacterium]|nr:AAA family ATPase [Longimicrobiales bacterium]